QGFQRAPEAHDQVMVLVGASDQALVGLGRNVNLRPGRAGVGPQLPGQDTLQRNLHRVHFALIRAHGVVSACTRCRAKAIPGLELVDGHSFAGSKTRREASASHLPRGPSSSFFITSSMLKLAGFCRGGNSLKLEIHLATYACAGTSRKARCAN